MKSIAWAIVLAAMIWDQTYRKVHLGETTTKFEGNLGMIVLACFIASVFL